MRNILAVVLCVAVSNSMAVPPAASLPGNAAVSPAAVSQTIDLSAYMDKMLQDAGFSPQLQAFLLGRASPQLKTVRASDLQYRARELKRNLSIFMSNLVDSIPSPSKQQKARDMFSKAELHPEPWEFIMSDTSLAFFKTNQIFSDLMPGDVTELFRKACPIWPLCAENS